MRGRSPASIDTTPPGRGQLLINCARSINPWWYASAVALTWAFFQTFDFLYSQWFVNIRVDEGQAPFIRAFHLTNVTLIGLAIVCCGLLKNGSVDRARGRLRQLTIALPLAIFLGLHFYIWWVSQRSAWLWVEDVGKSTVIADRALARGQDPYAIHSDPVVSDITAANLHGYKYFPLMMAAYAPAVAVETDGDKAILLANLVFSLIAAAVLAASGARWISPDAGMLCALLFFMSRLNSEELLERGSNDVVPMILVVLALLCIDARFLCGLLIGLAISSKMMPALLWIAFCLMPRNRSRYFGGVAAGLLPCLPFLLWHPGAFVRNAVLFPLTRPREWQSLFWQAPPWMGMSAKLVVLLIFMMFALRRWRRDMPPLRRCTCAALLTLCFELASPILHQNYFIWWYMPFCVAFTALIFDPVSYNWISRGRGATGSL
ncbi:MAG TPA: glycosyltransferase 87 family protein [Tepidisphaeraceae bacterium]|nr:glycosyltransferase 87 family protein [Tepidisphaeraceae bacterium]